MVDIDYLKELIIFQKKLLKFLQMLTDITLDLEQEILIFQKDMKTLKIIMVLWVIKQTTALIKMFSLAM